MFDPEILDPDPMDGFIEDVIRVVQPVVNDTVQAGKDAATSRGATLADELIRSTAFNRVLVEVDKTARQAVSKEVGANALALGGIACAAGIVGGTLLKGRTGLIVAAVLAAGGIYYLTAAQTAAKR